MDLARREESVKGTPVHLTPNEFRLLSVLIKHGEMVMTHRQLLRRSGALAAANKRATFPFT
jgi:two-component system, OmpR family, KDP operon response regulator KdpE